MKRVPLKGGEEQDVFSRRRHCRSNVRPGVTPSAKNGYRRRFRKAERKMTQREASE